MLGGSQRPYLHGVVGVLVVEDEGLLDELVVSLQLVDLGLVVDDVLLVLPQVRELVLQGAVHLDGDAADLLWKSRCRRRKKSIQRYGQFQNMCLTNRGIEIAFVSDPGFNKEKKEKNCLKK